MFQIIFNFIKPHSCIPLEDASEFTVSRLSRTIFSSLNSITSFLSLPLPFFYPRKNIFYKPNVGDSINNDNVVANKIDQKMSVITVYTAV